MEDEQRKRLASFTAIKIYEEINKPRYWMGSMGITQRMIKSWDEEGLISFDRASEDKRRAFSIADYFWLQCIHQFRSMGTPIPLLKALKQSAFSAIDVQQIIVLFKGNPELLRIYDAEAREKVDRFLQESASDAYTGAYPGFILTLVDALSNREPMDLILFGDGSSTYWSETRLRELILEETKLKKQTAPYVSVPLLSIAEKMMLNEELSKALPELEIYGEEELYLLELIRKGDLKHLKISFKNKKIKTVQLENQQQALKTYIQVVVYNAYRELILTLKNGKSIRIENT